ncbi:MAG TPA: prepilin-type N-terminal cleavage/methylation domain-containing protein [Thermohalobaculum sp.]|nr:prepilin-type N-terminal cleavage/methylation domain-containing protein [Thermohalobaculum sp.]
MTTRRAYPRVDGKRREDGFTLVELLVAMTLLAFLSIMLFGGLRFGARSWDAVVTSSSDRDEVAATQAFLRDRLNQMTLPGGRRSLRAKTESHITGEAQQMEVIAPWLSALSLGGLYRFTLWHEETDGNDTDGRLMLRWQPADADPDALEALGDLAGQRVLLDGVSAFSLSYYGAADAQSEPEWRDQWDDQDLPPRLVRVELVFADARRVWPNFVAATNF